MFILGLRITYTILLNKTKFELNKSEITFFNFDFKCLKFKNSLYIIYIYIKVIIFIIKIIILFYNFSQLGVRAYISTITISSADIKIFIWLIYSLYASNRYAIVVYNFPFINFEDNVLNLNLKYGIYLNKNCMTWLRMIVICNKNMNNLRYTSKSV